MKPLPLSIADFRLLRTHVVLVRASVARDIIDGRETAVIERSESGNEAEG